MKRTSRTVAVALGAFFVVAGTATSARAGCADQWLTTRQPGQHRVNPTGRDVAYRLVPASLADDNGHAIVGMWQFTFTSTQDFPPFGIHVGDPLDAGYAQWHDDGTEIMNSMRDPATSNFCLGVWKSAGPRSYALNHFALSWDNTGHLCTPQGGSPSCFVGPTNIREQVTVTQNSDSYAGTVTITQYDTHGAEVFTLTGSVSARRIDP